MRVRYGKNRFQVLHFYLESQGSRLNGLLPKQIHIFTVRPRGPLENSIHEETNCQFPFLRPVPGSLRTQRFNCQV